LHGICLFWSSNNTIIGNNITDNDYGIWLEHSSNNKIYHNNFVNNTENVHIGTSSSADFGDNIDGGNDNNDGCPLLTCTVIATAIIAGVIGVLLVYFTKVKRTTEKTKQ
jgi:parallel beta-helix repeat protein